MVRVQLTFNELLKLGSCSVPLKQFEYTKNQFYIRAWVAQIEPDGSLACIVSDVRPDIFNTAKQISKSEHPKHEDENEKDSRKDTLWGDLKLLSKKAYRDINHEIDHAKIQHDHSFSKYINLRVKLKEPKQVVPGSQVNLLITSAKTALPTLGKLLQIDLVILEGKISEDVFQAKGSLDKYLSLRSKVISSIVAASFIILVFSFKSVAP